MILNYYVGTLYQLPSNPGSYMQLVREGKETSITSYTKINSILTEILCANGTCPIF
jgi:hypothetical protein